MHIIGVIFILICTINTALEEIILKDVGTAVESIVVVDYLSFIILSGCSLINIFRGTISTLDISQHLCIGLFGFLGFST